MLKSPRLKAAATRPESSRGRKSAKFWPSHSCARQTDIQPEQTTHIPSVRAILYTFSSMIGNNYRTASRSIDHLPSPNSGTRIDLVCRGLR